MEKEARRVYLKKTDYEEHGYTIDCAGCRQVSATSSTSATDAVRGARWGQLTATERSCRAASGGQEPCHAGTAAQN